MRVPRPIPAVTLDLICALLIATCALAQQPSPPPSIAPAPQSAPPSPVHLRDYSQPRSAFPKFLQPYTPRQLELSNLGNSPRIDTLMRDEKSISLSTMPSRWRWRTISTSRSPAIT